MNAKSYVEQRRKRRFPGIDGALAAFSGDESHSFTNLGEIIDISESGLSLRYVGSKKRPVDPTSPSIDIFGYRGPHIHITGIPCKVIYEREIDVLGESATTKRCGVQFGDLTSIQKFQLEYFIRNYTLAGSPM